MIIHSDPGAQRAGYTCNRRPFWTITRLVILALVVGALTWWAGPTRAADQPYGGCKEAYSAPSSKGANQCRRAGWIIRSWVVVSPKKRLRYLGANRLCKTEDWGAQGGRWKGCVWEANGRPHHLILKATRHHSGVRVVALRTAR